MLVFENLKKREKVLLSLTFVLVVLGLIYNFVFAPILERYRLINQEITKSEVKLQKYIYLLGRKDKIRKDFDKISEIVKIKVSEEEEMALILSEIENLSQRSSVHITKIRPLAAKNFGTYKEFSVEVQAEAKIEDISQFVYDLQNSSQLLRTKRLRLNTKFSQSETLAAVILVVKISLP